MPGMSGPELSKNIRNLHPEARSLFMSGYTEHGIVDHGVLHEGISLLNKPFTHSTLIQKVRELLSP